MPTYQYQCSACEHAFEAFQSFSDEPLTSCPECKGEVKKVYSAVGVVFKGSGFYRTDSRGAATSSSAPTPTSTPPVSAPAAAPSTPAPPSTTT